MASSMFVDFSKAEIQQFKNVFGNSADYKNDKVVVRQDVKGDEIEITLVKSWKGKIYMEIEESDSEFDDRGDTIYLLEPIWWAKVKDIKKIFQDFQNGKLQEYNEYR